MTDHPSAHTTTKVRKILESVHVTAAGVWTGVLVMAGGSAAVLFPEMRSLEPRLPAYAAYEGEHWRLAAGIVQNEVFKIADVAQFALATVSLATILGMLVFGGLPTRRLSTALRIVVLCAAMSLTSYHLFILGPRMQASARVYWDAARAGDNTTAAGAQAAFNADHPTASRVLGTTAISTLALTVLGVWSAASAGDPPRGRGGNNAKRAHEEPALARGGA